MTPHRTDYYIGALVGFLVGVCAIPSAVHVGVRNPVILLFLPWIAAPLFALGIWLGKFLSRWRAFMEQFARFAAVGFLNAALDFGVLNTFSAITGITAGLGAGGINIPGFIIAVSNGYFWSKLWVFRANINTDTDTNAGIGVNPNPNANLNAATAKSGLLTDLPKFLLVSLIGLAINSIMVTLFTAFIPPHFGFTAVAWLNIAKILATVVALVWNFTGYKFFVFRPAHS